MSNPTNTLKIIGSGIGIVSGLLGIISAKGDLQTIGICALLIIVSISLLIQLYKAMKWHFTSVIGEQLPPCYSIREAVITDLPDIAKLQRSFYPDDAVPIELYNEWYKVNPEGFFVIESKTSRRDGLEMKELVGHFTFLAIKEDCMEIYREGEILETDIHRYNLYSDEEKDQIKAIYVESVIIKKAHRRHAMFCLVRMLKTMVCNFCDPKVVERVYAMAATKDGEKTLKGMGFTIVSRSKRAKRRDGHEMYESDFGQFYSTIIDRETKHEINMLHRNA